MVKADMARPAEANTMLQTLAEAISQVTLLKPIPEFSDAIDWPTIKSLIETDIPILELDARFLQQRSEIDREASEWCTRIQTSLADVLGQNLMENECLTELPIVGTIAHDQHYDPFVNLSPELQLCIRADSLFFPDQSLGSGSRPLASYDDYIKAIRQSVYGCHERRHERLSAPLDVARFQCHSKASTIVRALLKCLGRPANTSILELRLLDERFSCGRCDDVEPKSWLQMVSNAQ